MLQLSIYATGFVLRKQQLMLVAMQNIQNELEEEEMIKRTTDLTLTNRADLPEALELSRRVQIIRGSLQGSTGVIASYTSDKIYFIEIIKN